MPGLGEGVSWYDHRIVRQQEDVLRVVLALEPVAIVVVEADTLAAFGFAKDIDLLLFREFLKAASFGDCIENTHLLRERERPWMKYLTDDVDATAANLGDYDGQFGIFHELSEIRAQLGLQLGRSFAGRPYFAH